MIYFGTDGIRGTVGQNLNGEIAFKCGNALASLKKHAKILVGTDTRTSSDYLFSSLASGITRAGGDVVFVGIVPTPVVSFLVQNQKCDFGVMITASHNPPEDNGIKIFDCKGEKIDVETQAKIERGFANLKMQLPLKLGKIYIKPKLVDEYINYVVNNCVSLKGLKIALDLSNGASSVTAPKIFKKLGAKVIKTNYSKNGKIVNKNCGALYPENLSKTVLKTGADIGFAFDGDADRVIVVGKNGEIFDGDQILLFFAKMFKQFGLLKFNVIVGTILSNFGLENELKKLDIKIERTDVGDHNVEKYLAKNKLQIGGEPAGHIILFDLEKTGDGVLCATQVCKYLKMSNQSLHNIMHFEKIPQISKNIQTQKKYEIVNTSQYKQAVFECEQLLNGKGRIVTRASGTENFVRIMIECDNKILATDILKKLESVVKNI